MQAKMADMYTTLNACRSYLYSTARAVDKNIVSNKVQNNLSSCYFQWSI
jgi:isovaleryl-CoA dehydrogenase